MIVQILKELLLDPIYTGKVMAGLIDLVDKNIIDKNIPVIFIHTGGMPIIFSFESELGSKINCTKIYNKHFNELILCISRTSTEIEFYIATNFSEIDRNVKKIF